MTDILAQNPFLQPFGTPHDTVPFDRIRTEHFEPALREGIRRQLAEIDAITANPDTPTFANTIEAYERTSLATCTAPKPTTNWTAWPKS